MFGFTVDVHPAIPILLQRGMLRPLMQAVVGGLCANGAAKTLTLRVAASERSRSVLPQDAGTVGCR